MPNRSFAPLPFRLVLASGSPARRELLGRAGYAFDVLPANIPEPTEPINGDIRSLVQQVSWLKAAAVLPVPEGSSGGWIPVVVGRQGRR